MKRNLRQIILREKPIRDQADGEISRTGHSATRKSPRCQFYEILRLAARWPRITLRAYRKYALRVIGVVREPQECTKMIPKSFSEHFRKTLKISLLSQSCDINGPRFTQAIIQNLKQSKCETKSKTHNLERKTYPRPSWRWDFAHWALRDAKLTKMLLFGNFKTSCPMTPYYF